MKATSAAAVIYENSAVADVVATIPAWWERRAMAAGLPRPWHDSRRCLAPPPLRLMGAPRSDLLNASGFELGESYAAALTRRERLSHGRHYTPERLVGELWDELKRVGADLSSVADPACGAGALLIPAVRVLGAQGDTPAGIVASVGRRVSGTDLDPVAVWLGNAILAAELLPAYANGEYQECTRVPALLRVGDGLTTSEDSPAAIVMNPPFGRVRLDPAERARWAETLFGHANRYSLFLHAALTRVRPGGYVAAILPTSFLGGAYYQRLRAFIGSHAPLVHLSFVDERSGIFVGHVLQETCVAIFQRGRRAGAVTCARVKLNGSSSRERLPDAPAPPRQLRRPWSLPRRHSDGRLLAAAASLPRRLRDYGWSVSTGPLVWNRHKRQIFGSPAEGRLPILWAGDIRTSAVSRDPKRDSQRWLAFANGQDSLALREPAVLVQRTTAPEQPRRLVAAELTADLLAAWGGTVVVENHVNVLRCELPSSPLTPSLLARMLNTSVYDRLFRSITGTVAVSAYELCSLPLPDAATLTDWQALDGPALEAAAMRYFLDADR